MPRGDQKHRGGLVLEERRLKAAQLLHQGVRLAEAAGRLAVTPQAVNGWRRARERGGTEALHAAPRPGRDPFVERERLGQFPEILVRGTLDFGY